MLPAAGQSVWPAALLGCRSPKRCDQIMVSATATRMAPTSTLWRSTEERARHQRGANFYSAAARSAVVA